MVSNVYILKKYQEIPKGLEIFGKISIFKSIFQKRLKKSNGGVKSYNFLWHLITRSKVKRQMYVTLTMSKIIFQVSTLKTATGFIISWCAFALSSSKMKVKLFQVWLYKDGTTTTRWCYTWWWHGEVTKVITTKITNSTLWIRSGSEWRINVQL